MKHHEVTFSTTVTDEQIDEIMDSALNGIHYWADEAKSVSEIKTEYASQVISKNGWLVIHDAEEDKSHELTRDKFLTGLGLAIGSHKFDLDDYDMYDADKVIQLALFGELIYG